MPKSFRIKQIKIRNTKTKSRKNTRISKTKKTSIPRTSVTKGVNSIVSSLRNVFNKVKREDILREMQKLIVQNKKLSVLLFLVKSLSINENEKGSDIHSYRETLFIGIMRMKRCLAFHFSLNTLIFNLHNKMIPLLNTLYKISGRKTQRGGANFIQLFTSIIVYVFLIQSLIQAELKQSDETEDNLKSSGIVPINFKEVDRLHPISIRVNGKEFEFIKTTIMDNPMNTCSVRNEKTEESCMYSITESLDIDSQETTLKAKILSKPLTLRFFGTSVEELISTFNTGSFELNNNMKKMCERIIEMEERDVPSPAIWKYENMHKSLKKQFEDFDKKRKDRFVKQLTQKKEDEIKSLELSNKETKNRGIQENAVRTLSSFFSMTPIEVFPVKKETIVPAPASPKDYSNVIPEKLMDPNNYQLAPLKEEIKSPISQNELDSVVVDIAKMGLCEKGTCPTNTPEDSRELHSIIVKEHAKFHIELEKVSSERNKEAYFDKLCKKSFENYPMARFNETGDSMEVYIPTSWYMIRVVLSNMIYHIKRDYPELVRKEITDVDITNPTNARLKGIYELSFVFLKIINDFEETMTSTYRLTPSTTAEVKKTSIKIFDEINYRISETHSTDFPLSKKYAEEKEMTYQQKRQAIQQARSHREESVKDTSQHYLNLVASAAEPIKEGIEDVTSNIGEILQSSIVNIAFDPLKDVLTNIKLLGKDVLNAIFLYSSIGVFIILILKFGLLYKTSKAISNISETGTNLFTRKKKLELEQSAERNDATRLTPQQVQDLFNPNREHLPLPFEERVNLYRNYFTQLDMRREFDEKYLRYDDLKIKDPDVYYELNPEEKRLWLTGLQNLSQSRPVSSTLGSDSRIPAQQSLEQYQQLRQHPSMYLPPNTMYPPPYIGYPPPYIGYPQNPMYLPPPNPMYLPPPNPMYPQQPNIGNPQITNIGNPQQPNIVNPQQPNSEYPQITNGVNPEVGKGYSGNKTLTGRRLRRSRRIRSRL
jgi:hypothetical protein